VLHTLSTVMLRDHRVTGDIGNVDVTVPTSSNFDYTMAPLFTDISFSPLCTQWFGASGSIREPGRLRGLSGSDDGWPRQRCIAPDFNGDGVVDLADFAIWQSHVGQMSGASVLDGDADGDGTST